MDQKPRQPNIIDLQDFQQVLELHSKPLKPEEMIAVIKPRTEQRKVKTEEKRQETAKFLEEKRARNEEESKVKLFSLPDSVWEKEILTLVKDPKDLGSMWEVHPKFRQLSGESQSMECLLSKILTIEKLPHLWEDRKTRISKLKMFRTLSKGMRASVDHCFDEISMTLLRSPGAHQPLINIGIDDSLEDDNEYEVLDKLLADFCGRPIQTCPKRILHRAIRVAYSPGWLVTGKDKFGRFTSKVTTLLGRIGDQIWHFNLTIWSRMGEFFKHEVTMNEVYLFLRECVSLMSNLKRLELTFSAKLHLTNGTISREILQQQHPFPRLNALERFYFGEFQNVKLRSAIATSVIRANLQIKALDFVEFPTQEEDCLFFTELKPLLFQLKLSRLGGNHELARPVMKILQPLVCKEWNLKSLSGWTVRESSELRTVFGFLNKIKTLEHLVLDAEDFVVGEEELPCIILPNLVLFKMDVEIISVNYSNLENVIFFTSLGFLFQCEKLMTLDWSFSGWQLDSVKKFREFMFDNEENEMIKFKCGFQDLTKSNLRDVFPQLELVKTCVATDDGRENKPRGVRKSKLLS